MRAVQLGTSLACGDWPLPSSVASRALHVALFVVISVHQVITLTARGASSYVGLYLQASCKATEALQVAITHNALAFSTTGLVYLVSWQA
jgi:hypothetical protein